ncbi:MAG: hypothetical protein AAF564_14910 [Bacteroidota bacterium]
MEHLAFVNAVLGGFAFAFLGALITIDKSSRILSVAQVVVAVAACFFLVATLGSTMLSGLDELESFAHLRRPISLSFFGGLFFLLVSIGLSGWLRSRSLGISTSLIALVTGFGAWYMLVPFIR